MSIEHRREVVWSPSYYGYFFFDIYPLLENVGVIWWKIMHMGKFTPLDLWAGEEFTQTFLTFSDLNSFLQVLGC
jgi:hypothetical protein